MTTYSHESSLRFAIPQVLTGLRGLLGAAAFFAALGARLDLSAQLIILGVVTDNLDGMLARKLKVPSEFGARFDYYVDYLCYVVVPAALTFKLVEPFLGIVTLLALSLPLVTGAVRYSRNIGLAIKEDFAELGIPGLGTLFYGFFVIALVFLVADRALSGEAVARILVWVVPVFSLLMLAPLRYPKMVNRQAVLVPVVLGLNLMPFLFTRFLAELTIGLILLYAFFSPLLIRQRIEESDSKGRRENRTAAAGSRGGLPCG